MLASDIISDARDILSDQAKDRWSDTRLMNLLSDGISDIAKNTTILVEPVFFAVADDVVDMDFSTQVLRFVGAEYLDKEIKFQSYEEMSKIYGKDWQFHCGQCPKALVYDRQKNGLFKIYPKVSNAYNPYIVYSSPYGICTGISYSDIIPVLANSIGDLGSIDNAGIIKLYVVKVPVKVTSLTQVLAIDPLCKEPLVHFIAGKALRDNQDAQNRQMAAEELALYAGMTDQYTEQKAKGFSSARIETQYNPMGI